MRALRHEKLIFICASAFVAFLAVSNLPRLWSSGARIPVVHADGGCSLASLQGNYAVHGQGTFLIVVRGFPAPPFPFAEAGIATFDGNGKFFGKTTVNAGGVVLNPTFTGTYTVSGDCTGSVTVQSNAGFTIQEAIVVIGGGQRYVGTETDTTAVIARTVERLREGD